MKLIIINFFVFCFLLCFFGLNTIFSQSVFPERCGMIRHIQGGKYSFLSVKTEKVLDASAFSFASDFSENRAIVNGKNENSFGVIDMDGNLVLDTIFTKILPSQYGFMLVSREIAGNVYEDRGTGMRKYPQSEWLLAKSETGNVIDEIRFSSVTQIGNILLATDKFGKDYSINVQKINLALYDPFMKAIETIDDHPIQTTVDQSSGSVRYASKENDQLMLTNPINSNPEKKYRVTYTNR